MKTINNQAFTLVELLIVVAILAVLATVGFVSYSNYLTGVRDTNRVTQLVGIRNAIETFKTTKDTPLPEEKIDIEVNGELIAYQGIVGQNILNQIGLSDGGTDPKDETYFPYYVTKDRKYFQLMTFLEDEPDTEEELTFFPQTYASTDYSIRYPKVIGFPLGILTEKDTNTPLHEIKALTGTLDVATTSDEYTAYFRDEDTITGTGDVLLLVDPNANCKRILDMGRSKGDGFYIITPAGSESLRVYCDMTNYGGGWMRTHFLEHDTLVSENTEKGYKGMFTKHSNYNNNQLRTDITNLPYTEFLYLTDDIRSNVEFLEGGKIKTVGNKNEGFVEWISVYSLGSNTERSGPWYYYIDIGKINKETLQKVDTGFRNMGSERLLKGGNSGSSGNRQGTNFPFGKRSLGGNWCYGGSNNCWEDDGEEWASLWLR